MTAAQLARIQRRQDRLTAAMATLLVDARLDGMCSADAINATAATLLAIAGFTPPESRSAVAAALRRAGEMAIGAAVALELRKP